MPRDRSFYLAYLVLPIVVGLVGVFAGAWLNERLKDRHSLSMVINSSGVMQNGLLPYDVVLTNDGDFTETNVYAVVELSFDVPIDELSTTWTYSPSSLAFQEGYRSVGKLRSRTEELTFPTLHPGETVVFHFETGQDVNISAAARSDTASTEDITIEGTFPLDSGVSS